MFFSSYFRVSYDTNYYHVSIRQMIVWVILICFHLNRQLIFFPLYSSSSSCLLSVKLIMWNVLKTLCPEVTCVSQDDNFLSTLNVLSDSVIRPILNPICEDLIMEPTPKWPWKNNDHVSQWHVLRIICPSGIEPQGNVVLKPAEFLVETVEAGLGEVLVYVEDPEGHTEEVKSQVWYDESLNTS